MNEQKLGVVAVEADTLEEALSKLNESVAKDCIVGCAGCTKALDNKSTRSIEFNDEYDIEDYDRIWNKPARYKVLIHKPAVILIDKLTGEKYVSKASPEETDFNVETGLMMCFAKLAGMNYQKLIELLNSAELIIDEEPVKETDQRALPKKEDEKTYTHEVFVKKDANTVEVQKTKTTRTRKQKKNMSGWAIQVGKKFLEDMDIESGYKKLGSYPIIFTTKEQAQEAMDKLKLPKSREIVEVEVREEVK